MHPDGGADGAGAVPHPACGQADRQHERDQDRVKQELARQLRTPPSRLVPLVDHLEERGLIERRRNPDDRRLYALFLTAEGGQFVRTKLGPVGAAHEDDICAALTEDERGQLAGLLGRIAGQQGLIPGVHPGYQQLGAPERPEK